MTVHNRRWDCCGDRLPLVPSAIHPGEQDIARSGLAAGATAAPAGRPLSTPPRQGRATPRPRPPHSITPTRRPSATGPPTLGPGRDTPPPLPSCRRSPRRLSATAGALRVPVLTPSLAAAPRAAGGPSHLDHRPRHTERVTQRAAHTARQRTRPNPEEHMPDPGGYRDKRPPAKSKTSSAARGLGYEHRRNRGRMHPNHIDGTPCPCGVDADCGQAASAAEPATRSHVPQPGPQSRRHAAHGRPLERSQSRRHEGRPTRARRLQPLPRCS
jgi:hypothetical protein